MPPHGDLCEEERFTPSHDRLSATECPRHHHTQSPFHQARSVPQGVRKTVFDAWNGYHSVALHQEDRHYTTFITPWGRYRYRTAPQGYIASGDGYTRRYDEVVSSFPNKTKCIDDTLLWSPTIEDCFFQDCQWLDICGRHGITLNPDKFHFAKEDVEFAGFEIGNNTVKPCKKYHLRLPHPKESHRCQIMVRSGIIRVQHDRHHAPVQEPPQTEQHLSLGR